jgi:hypothetical protein
VTLSDLTTQFQSLMNRADLKSNSALSTTFITQAILRIQRELRSPMQEATIVYTIPITYVATTGLAIPNDFLELIDLFAGANQEVTLQRSQIGTVKNMAANWPAGHTIKFARLGGNWILAPSPQVGDVITIQYYASFSPLVAPTDFNTLTMVAWDAPLYGALSAACDFYEDARVDKFEKRYMQIVENLQGMADGDELTADAALAPVYEWPDDANGT